MRLILLIIVVLLLLGALPTLAVQQRPGDTIPPAVWAWCW